MSEYGYSLGREEQPCDCESSRVVGYCARIEIGKDIGIGRVDLACRFELEKHKSPNGNHRDSIAEAIHQAISEGFDEAFRSINSASVVIKNGSVKGQSQSVDYGSPIRVGLVQESFEVKEIKAPKPDCDPGEPVSIPDKFEPRQVERSGFSGEIEFGEPIEGTVELFEFPKELDARIAELHLDVLATADEMRAEIARQNRAFQTMLWAQVVVCLVLALLSLRLVGGGQ